MKSLCDYCSNTCLTRNFKLRVYNFKRRVAASNDNQGRVGIDSTRIQIPLSAPSLRPPPPPPPPSPEQVCFLVVCGPEVGEGTPWQLRLFNTLSLALISLCYILFAELVRSGDEQTVSPVRSPWWRCSRHRTLDLYQRSGTFVAPSFPFARILSRL